MSAPIATAEALPRGTGSSKVPAATRIKKGVGGPIGSAVAVIIAFLWIMPTFGLLVSSFRPAAEIRTTGW